MSADRAADGPEVFVVAGEASGDMIGALLVRELLARRPDLRVTGLGGPRMAEAGMRVDRDIVREFAIIGLGDVLLNIRRLRRLFHETVAAMRERRPAAVVFIDYPGLNLRLAREARALGLRVVYYVIPQVWAWKKGRVRQLAERCDRRLVILPFEARFLRENGTDGEFVGHPLMDSMRVTTTRDEVFRDFGFDPGRRLIGLLPGSRRREIDALLPVMLGAAERLLATRPDLQFALPRAHTIEAEHLRRHLARSPVPVSIVERNHHDVRAAMDFAMVASGTATLETGLLGTPLVVLYKVRPLTWYIGRMLVKLPGIGLVNIVAEETIAPEVLQGRCRPGPVAEACARILDDPAEMARIRERLGALKERLGGPGASARAAEAVLEEVARA